MESGTDDEDIKFPEGGIAAGTSDDSNDETDNSDDMNDDSGFINDTNVIEHDGDEEYDPYAEEISGGTWGRNLGNAAFNNKQKKIRRK